jgi:Mrp family chromosome partitioning ATPase
MLASVVLGLILAGVVAAVAYKSSAAFDLAEQIRNELRVPVLGEIPSTRELRGANADIGSLLSADLPTLVEAFQSLRINTEVQLAKGSKVLSITSWERGEGKSTVTAALGIMLGAVGHDVVLIDTDLRAPSLHERLQEPFGEGLAEFDELGLIMTLRETKYPNLSFIPAGLPDRHPAQIIAVALHQAIEAVRRQRPNSIILLDTPSLGPVNEGGRKTPRVVAETSTVVRTADEVLLVVSATTNKLFDIAGGVDRLREDGVSVAGAVINRYRKRGWRPF